MDILCAPLTADLWDDFALLFGPSGACYGCWCQHFRLPPKVRQATPADGKKALMRQRVSGGPPPGLLAYAGGKAVGWMQIGPRSDVPEWNNPGRVTAPVGAPGPGDWAISCFFVKGPMRGKGLSHFMLAEGIEFARRSGAHRLEACPIDKARQSKSVGLFVGSTRVFAKAGFTEIALRKPGRPLMRLEL